MPILNVQNMEVGHSHEQLKYRAVKGIFLAHQKGVDTHLAVKIETKLVGPFRELQLIAIESLFLYGEKETGFSKKSDFYKIFTSRKNTKISANAKKNLLDSEAERRLFTLMTKSEVLFDMYIETFDYTKSAKMGVNSIDCVIFLRRYPRSPWKDVVGKQQPKGKFLITSVKSVASIPESYVGIEWLFQSMHRVAANFDRLLNTGEVLSNVSTRGNLIEPLRDLLLSASKLPILKSNFIGGWIKRGLV